MKRIHELELPGEEWIWAKVQIQSISLIICCIYLPPNATAERQTEFINRLTESTARAHTYLPTSIIILGDMNVGNIFLHDTLTDKSSGITPFDIKFKDAIEGLDLTQLIQEPTRIDGTTANLRDLLFISSPDMILDTGVHSPFSQLDHFPIFAVLNVKRQLDSLKRRLKLWDYDNLDPQLSRIEG